jgi:2',3'-cyclic-nucleotide 2'-phosphodiesterase/3'-nucleotidase
MKHRHPLLFVAAVALLSMPAYSAADTELQLRILETTDIHVHIMDYDYYQDQPSMSVGLVRTASLIKAARAEVRNSVLVDNGDLLQGNPLGDFIARERGLGPEDVHPVYKAMNLLDYTVGNVGNHEFNYGLEFLERSIDGANFPYISANVFHDDGDDIADNDQPYFDQYIVVEQTLIAADGSEHGIRIGFIGFVPPQIMKWDLSNLRGRVTARDIVETARDVVPRMKAEGADLVIAIPHSGLTTVGRRGMDENATYYLSTVPGIDAIMFGHSHRVFPSESYRGLDGVDVEKGTINGVPATMPGFWGNHLGYVDLQLSVSDEGKWKVLDGVGIVESIFARDGTDVLPLVAPAEEIVAAVREEHEATIQFIRTGVGEITAPITTYFALVQDDASVQIVTDAQKRYIQRLIQGTEFDGLALLSASAPFKFGGRSGAGNFTHIAAGPITLSDVADLYIYPNTVRAVLITGAEVREWLEMSAGAFNRIDPDDPKEQKLLSPDFRAYNFDVIDGVDYQIDLAQPRRYDTLGQLVNADSHRIVGLSYAGRPIDPDQQFVVVTNNYRAGGGGNFPGLDGSNIIIEAPDTNRDALADYIFEAQKLRPSADGNWSFAAIDGEVNVTFISAADAYQYLSPQSRIVKTGAGENGFGKYRIMLGR